MTFFVSVEAFANSSSVPIVAFPGTCTKTIRLIFLANCLTEPFLPATSKIDRALDNWLEVLDHSMRRDIGRQIQVMEKAGG